MSYCVNCGVELDPSAKTCPLCGMPAWHPELDAPPYFPANSAAVQPASKREAAILLTAMLVSVSLCCGLLNLFLPTDRPWSLYVIGAAVSRKKTGSRRSTIGRVNQTHSITAAPAT